MDVKEHFKILIIDDDDVDRMAVRRALNSAMPDASVDEAASAAQAIEVLRTGGYDCALLDYMLPDGDGLSVLRDVRAAGVETPVVMLTGQGNERLIVELLHAGASDYLPKAGLSPEALSHSIQVAVRLARAESERQRAQQALRESEARSRAIVHEAADGIITINEMGVIQIFSPAAERMFGYAADEVIGQNVKLLMPEPEHHRHDGYLRHYRETGEAHLVGAGPREVVAQCKNGSTFPLELAINEMHLDDQRCMYVGIMRDITKRKQAEENLRLSEERFALVTRGTRDGLWDWDLTSGEIYFSPRWKAMLGYSEDEIENNFLALQALIHPDDLGHALNVWVVCMEGETDAFSVEYRLRDKQGDYCWIHSRGLSVRNSDDEPVRIAGSHTDITERKRMEEELQKISARQRYLMDNSPAIIYSAVPSGDFKITFVSDNITRIFGYEPAEILADADFWFIHIHPDDRDGIFSRLPKLFSEGQQIHEYRFQRKDGGYHWIHDTMRVICNDEGEPAEVLGSLMDITERKQMEDALHAEKAEQQILIKKLQEAQNQLLQSEKMASIGQLAAGVAHEINNPVGYISSNISTLQGYINNLIEMVNLYEISETGQRDDQEWRALITSVKEKIDLDYLRQDIQDLIKESQEGVQRVKQIVQDLKDFSHVDEAEWQWADLHKGLDSTLNVVNNELKYKAEVVKEYGDLPAVECLASQLNQVFMNLLVNAAHAIEERGTITVRTGTQNDGVWVEIEDTGKGMDAETQRKIFDPFFTTKPVGSGTGLGLSLSYGIIQKHNGTITVESEVGKGTRFHVWLPVKQQPDTSNDLQEEGDVDNTSQVTINSARRGN